MTRAKAPRGAPDLLPPDSELLSEIEARSRLLFDRYGYRRIETPVFEHTEVFIRTIGESSDIVRKEMYTFTDRADRSLTLRPEATAPTVRAFVEHRLDGSMPMPARLFSIGPMFRYERPQKGRQRQFFQINAEAIGSGAPLVDAEIILLGMEIYEGLGLRPELLLNSMGCAADRERYGPVLREALGERADDLCDDCLERLRTNPLRVFDCKVPECREIVRAQVPPVVEYLCDDCRAHFDGVQEILETLGVAWKTAPDLVRGFDYYTRTVFEYDLPSLGPRSALGGGGRYDGLVEEFGGPPLPGVGLAVGVWPTMVALKEVRDVEGWKPDVYVVWLGDLAPVAMATAMDLRRAGLQVTLSDEPRSIRAQLRSADRYGASRAVILGPDEVARKAATVRNLGSGDQEEVPLDELVSRLTGA